MRSARAVAMAAVIAVVCVSAAPLPRSRQNETIASRSHRLTDKDKNSPKRKETVVVGDAVLEGNAGTKATHDGMHGTPNKTADMAEVTRNDVTLDTLRDARNTTTEMRSDVVNSTESDAGNGSTLDAKNQTAYGRVNETSSEVASGGNMTNMTPFIFVMPVETSKTFDAYRGVHDHCILPTCLTANLGSSLQGGDEKAGDTSDPFGIGKK